MLYLLDCFSAPIDYCNAPMATLL